MNNAIVNEAFVRTVAQDKTLPAFITSLGKFFTRGYNAVLSPRNEHSQSTSTAAAGQPPLKSAEEMAALTQSIKAQMTAYADRMCGHLPTLRPLIVYLDGVGRDISYDNIEYLINERIEGAEKHNFLRTLITDLDRCSQSHHGDEHNKKVAMAALQKEVCDLPFKSYGNLNRQQHGEIFNSKENRERFKDEIMTILNDLQKIWRFAAADDK